MKSVRRIIGIDESGKGDFFGPLVIASFLADEGASELLRTLGVRDGKLLSENRILQIDRALRADFPHCLVVLTPDKYNRQYEKIRNLNKLLAEGHAQAIEKILKSQSADVAISDKFGKPELIESALGARGRKIELRQIVRGEAVVQVAAASILARARFIEEMEKLSASCGIELPRGAAAHVDEAGRQLVRKHGREMLSKVAKVHFKNYQRVIHPTLFSGRE